MEAARAEPVKFSVMLRAGFNTIVTASSLTVAAMARRSNPSRLSSGTIGMKTAISGSRAFLLTCRASFRAMKLEGV